VNIKYELLNSQVNSPL